MKKNLLVVIAAVMLALALGEIALRAAWTNPYRDIRITQYVEMRQLAHPLSQRLSRKWMNGEDEPVVHRTNARGYMEPALVHERPELTIAFFGGSTTECQYVAESQRFPALVGSALNARGIKVNVLNAARSGNTSHDSLNLYLNHVVQDKPAIVVIMHAVNDRGVLARDPSYLTRSAKPMDTGEVSRFSTQWFSSHSSLGGLFRLIKTNLLVTEFSSVGFAGHVDQVRADPEPFRSRLSTFVGAVRSFGAVPVLMTQPLLITRDSKTPEWANMSDQERFNQVIRDVSASQKVPLVDLEARMRLNGDFGASPLKYLYDGMHATDLGSQVYASEIVTVLAPLAAAAVKR